MSGFTRQSTANCPACGSPIIRGYHLGEFVPIDSVEVMSGPSRFAIVDWHPRVTLASVTSEAQVPAYTDHRTTCPRR